jgi:hypothetical protein
MCGSYRTAHARDLCGAFLAVPRSFGGVGRKADVVRTGAMAADRCWYEKDCVVGSGPAVAGSSVADREVRAAAGAAWRARVGVRRAAAGFRPPRVGAGPAVADEDPAALVAYPGMTGQACVPGAGFAAAGAGWAPTGEDPGVVCAGQDALGDG